MNGEMMFATERIIPEETYQIYIGAAIIVKLYS